MSLKRIVIVLLLCVRAYFVAVLWAAWDYWRTPRLIDAVDEIGAETFPTVNATD